MIKLLWNTHNLKKPINEKLYEQEMRDYLWGLYHKKNSDKWIYEVLDKVQYKLIEDKKDIKSSDVLLIVDSSVEKKVEFYKNLKSLCSKIYLIHLGDEGGSSNLNEIYNNFNFVWRTFCLNRYFDNESVSCLPIGYKSGTSLIKKKEERKYIWTFIGTPHKSSRHDLLFQLSNIEPSFSHKTKKFNEKNIIEVNEMSEILSSTKFVPCPNGFVHPETYRVYEALECECIPIVESAYKYYDRLFPKNPFLQVDKWQDAKLIIENWKEAQIKKKQEECKIWWSEYKTKIQTFIQTKVNT